MTSDHSKLLEIIVTCTDSAKLNNWISNALREGATDIEDAARRRLIEISSAANSDDPNDEMVSDFWRSITALELALSDERGKTIRLSRTRQKITRVGVQETLADLALQPKPSEGYFLLQDRDMLDMSAEAVVLRFANRFEPDVVRAAQKRLGADGFSLDS
ncbi:hypothetical protein [Parasedimentitalea huanghaiensis]|uniref:Uncharacterized protein n=1 Tax=Parasedimentitalea huanghaiensis TaxID=2682100 RepID=A0A6L6WMB5_9RHOB|nr:hypothetical protein [Zongyanglinia huanghaiensis]MVO18368.1 hypothetical protein [Zongyanglinia huanghaiensis]